MNYLALARKWRPKTFSELVGQEHVVKALRNALDSGRVHHAFLFTGTRGVGKTTIARIFAKSLNCETGVRSDPCGVCGVCLDVDAGRFVDLIEIDAASRTKVDDTRELLEDVVYAPSRGRYKVFLIDEVHMLSGHSFNALLKTLEEPPEHVKFLLATTDPQKLPVTVLSRCLQFNLRRLSSEEIAGQMSYILAAEGIASDPAALALLALGADGSVRDGLSLLDQAIAHGGGRLDEAEVRAMLGTIDQDAVLRLLEALAAGDGPALYAAIESVAGFVADFAGVLGAVATALHRIQLRQLLPVQASSEESIDPVRLQALADAFAPEDVQLYYQMATQGSRDITLAPTQRIGLEMCLLRMLAFRPEPEGAPATGPQGTRESAAGNGTPTPQRTASATADSAAHYPRSNDAEGSTDAFPTPGAVPASHAGMRNEIRSENPPPSPPVPEKMIAPVTPVAATGAAKPIDNDKVRSASSDNPVRSSLPADTVAWAAMLDRMGVRAAVRQLADNCTVLGERDGALRLGLPREHELLLSEMSRRQIEQGVSAAMGAPTRVHIEIVDDPKDGASAVPIDTPAVRARVASDERQRRAEAEFAADPAVQSALAAFGAEIVQGSVRPR
jgi:DNA polymerase-3 subunit gamma/tau